ncbi:uncharacterized protein KQ657_004253 [Scheffersomyces spartinae]|uniref:Uncharacterized protein n=1 Tax=Scheffersomyces spartinae TaxID=45513 RepID=A0A9P8AJ78_9ASCO|nr:uncharacterized protein KQ657_004253 [Scheffersomyces spartinae]KAG7194579.1 hypothetical protein KQ657_004253 [Scheffersomyces spartinae]
MALALASSRSPAQITYIASHMEGAHQQHSALKSPHYAAFSSQPLPTSSLRDITALVFILMSLPQNLATPLLALYIFADSSFVYVRMLALFVLVDSDEECRGRSRLQPRGLGRGGGFGRRLWELVDFSKTINAIGRFIAILAFNSMVYFSITRYISFHKRNVYFNHLVILAKATILADIIGSSSINSVTSISNKKFASKIQFENKHLNNGLLNSIACYLIVNYTTYCVNWLLGMNHGALDSINQYSELYLVLCLHVVISSIYRNSFHSNSHNKNNFHAPNYNVMKLDDGGGGNRAIHHHHTVSTSAEISTLIDGDSSLVSNATTTGAHINNPIHNNNNYTLLSNHNNSSTSNNNNNNNNNNNSDIVDNCSNIITTTTTTSTPTSRTTTTILSTGNDEPSTKVSSNVTHVNGSALVTLPASISSSTLKLTEETPDELVEIDLSKVLQNERFENEILGDSIQLHNFEVFILKPFNNKLLINRNRSFNPISKYPSLCSSNNEKSDSNIAYSESNSGGNSTTIIDNMITIQPFWSVVASFKAAMKYTSLFDGQMTRRKTHGGEFLALPSAKLEISILTIDDSKILMNIMLFAKNQSFDIGKIRIKINSIDWMYFKICEVDNECYLLVYGLSALFQYEIDIFHELQLLNHLIISTTTPNKDKVLNQLPSEQNSSLLTLQISLVLTIELLSSKKSSYKKMKKDEHKKISELTKTIDAFKNRIAKYNGKQPNESRIFGKLKGLKHQVNQLEAEVQELKRAVEQLDQNKDASRIQLNVKETELQQELAALDQEYEQAYLKAVNEVKMLLKEAELENANIISKNQKNSNKEQQILNEINKLDCELKNMKKIQVLGKIQKRTKKVKDKIDTIIPRVFESTAELQRKFEELVGSDYELIEESNQ